MPDPATSGNNQINPELISNLQNAMQQNQLPQETPQENISPTAPTPQYYPQQEQVDPTPYLLAAQMEQLQQNNAQLQNALYQMQISALPPEDQEPAMAALAYAQYLQQKEYEKQQLAFEREQIAQYARYLEQATMPFIKDKVTSKYSQKEQIDKELLDLASSPRELMLIAETAKKLKNKQTNQQRTELGIDNVGGTGGGAARINDASLIKKQFKGSGNLEGYIRALRGK